MMNIGFELRSARSRRGLSLEDISRATKVKPSVLLALEEDDPQPLPPLVYVLGYLRAYATEVGIDPEPIVDRYLEYVDALAHDVPAFAVQSGACAPSTEEWDPADSHAWSRRTATCIRWIQSGRLKAAGIAALAAFTCFALAR